MKKYIGFIIVLFVFVLGALNAEAVVNPNLPCASTATPSITILSPNGGEVYQVGQQIPISWKSCNIPSSSNFYITLNYINGDDHGSVSVLGEGQGLNDGSDIITITPSIFSNLNGLYGKNYTIGLIYNTVAYATSTTNIQYRDYSDSTFTINNTTSEVAPSIKVLSPNGGEKYLTGQQVTVKWETKGIPSSDKVVIVLDPSPETNAMGQDGYNMSGSEGTMNDGIETYALGSGVYGKFKVRVLKLNNNTIKDSSDDYFTIAPLASSNCDSSTTPYIKVISPNGGEVYNAGQQIEVKWKSCNIVAKYVGIYLQEQDSISPVLDILDSSVLNSNNAYNSYLVKLPTEVKYTWGKNFKIFISNDASGGDYSDDTLTINSPSYIEIEETGCSKGEKYSSTTGQICTLYGCQHGENYSSATGKACSKPVSVYPSGCNSLEGNSSTTGVKCAGACSVSGAGCGTVNTPSGIGKILKQGVKDEEVKILQSFLNLTADGSFGPKTMNAVKLFQAEKGLTADGVVGPKTWMYINK